MRCLHNLSQNAKVHIHDHKQSADRATCGIDFVAAGGIVALCSGRLLTFASHLNATATVNRPAARSAAWVAGGALKFGRVQSRLRSHAGVSLRNESTGQPDAWFQT